MCFMYTSMKTVMINLIIYIFFIVAPCIKNAKVQVKQTNIISDFSSDDDQPLVKKQRTRLTEKVVNVVETVKTRSRQNLLMSKDQDKTSISR